ncbi:DUF3885 domain-containing protein [Vagococcus bubulae]|uniref:DUF3885 domain-containing protein n=1 Tax=Vagococcus bubulae TaxID=1977868 RepID=A0A429ZQA4_9ENTE|nr:hypothetical protein [Vagococcus bubulae]RST95894.1 hypothetical protein CBF36_01625 [Vagococcus bubulae]
MKGFLQTDSLETLFSYQEAVDLHPNMYQFLEDSSYNEEMFFLTYTTLKSILTDLFFKDDKVILLINKYPLHYKNKTDKILYKLVKNMGEITLSEQTFDYLNDDIDTYHRLQIETTCSNIKWKQLILCVINQDFPDRRPQFNRKNSLRAPEIYLVSPTSETMIYVYDDRGYIIYSDDKNKKIN